MLPHDARQYLFDRLRELPAEERERLREASIGARLRWAFDQLRARYPHLTLAEIAAEVGVTRQALWYLLQGKTERPSAQMISGICHALGLPMSFAMLGLVPGEPSEHGLPADLLRFALNPANARYVVPALELALYCSRHAVDPEVVRCLADAVRRLYLSVTPAAGRRGAGQGSAPAPPGPAG